MEVELPTKEGIKNNEEGKKITMRRSNILERQFAANEEVRKYIELMNAYKIYNVRK